MVEVVIHSPQSIGPAVQLVWTDIDKNLKKKFERQDRCQRYLEATNMMKPQSDPSRKCPQMNTFHDADRKT